LRLFFALWPDAQMRERVADAAAILRLDSAARRVPAENFHLTLAFVGEVSDSKLAAVRQIGCDLRAAACEITLDALEYWPESQAIVAAARDIPVALLELWGQLHRELALHSAILQRYRPPTTLLAHVTLARKVSQAPVLQAKSPLSWSARSFSLVCSDTRAVRSVYTVVDTWPLLDEMGKS
jgi:RNA 2',3'-cyclic 3'-phosphodiesterase